jgi:hypothetical protein
MSSVLLNPVTPGIYCKSGLEPQYVTVRDPNRAVMYLDSQDNTLILDKTNMQISTARFIGDSPSQLASGICRIGLASAGVWYNIPNVNPRNNTITFYSSFSSSTHTVTVPEGFYTTPTALITAIRDALNTATGSSGLTFSFTTITGFPSSFNLLSAGGNYYFDLTCTGVKYGYQLWNLPVDQVASNTKVVGSISGFYTRFIDMTSVSIVQYAKIKTVSSAQTPNLVVRIFVDDPTYQHFVSVTNIPEVSYSFMSTEPIYSLQFQLLDQFGQTLYVPSGASGTAGGFFWDCQLLIEI